MSTILTPDICVIGAGSAGLTTAAGARAVGLSVVLIEAGEMGGECLNTGCVPSKALIAAARHAAAIRRAEAFGVHAGPPSVDAEAVHRHVRSVIDGIAPHDSQERFTGLGATVLRSRAHFVDRETVQAGDTTIRARRFVIATGSRPALPPVEGLPDVPVLTNESVFDLTALPRHLVVLGAGAIAMELAQAFHRLGSAVTVLARSRPLSKEDPELADVVVARLKAEGVAVLSGVEPVRVARSGETVTLDLTDGSRLEASHLLVAAGRTPNVAGLDLEAAGVVHDRSGVETDAALRTSNRRIFAIGDVTRHDRFTHWAGHQGGLVVRTVLTGWPAKLDPRRLPAAIYTDPELARVGLSEAEARARYGDRVRILRAPFADNDRARADRAPEGLVKLIVSPRGRLLGAGVVGEAAGEVIAAVAVALAGGVRLSTLASVVLPYPTLSEAVKRAAVSSYSEGLKKRSTQRLLAFIRAIGRRIG